MKKLLIVFLGFGLFSQQAIAVMVLGKDFAGHVNAVTGSGGNPVVDLGPDAGGDPTYSYISANIENNITDLDAASWVAGVSPGAFLDLAFNVGVVDGVDDDLEIFFVGENGHKFDLTIGSTTLPFTVTPPTGNTGFFDDLYGIYPIYSFGIDLADFAVTAPVTDFRITIGDGWCDASTLGTCSAVPSFVGAYSVVPIPAAVWLFGSGLVGLVGLARRRRK